MKGFFVKKESSDGQVTTKRKRRLPKTGIFICLMLAYPLFHFFLMWFGVNINSILLTFQYVPVGGGSQLQFVGWDNLFHNYSTILQELNDPIMADMYKASLVYLVLNCFITLPISLFFAYFIFKKIYAAGIFKTVFYLPSVLPIVALTTVFSMSFSASGFMTEFLKVFGLNISYFDNEHAKWMVWIFCFWTGIGYNVMLLTAGMSKIPRDLLESSKMDGVPPLKEFFHIIIPLTWPTITTLFIFGMMGVFGTYLQPMLLVGNNPNTFTNTIGLIIFQESTNVTKNHPATIGLMCTLIGTPIILGTRALLNHFFKEVSM